MSTRSQTDDSKTAETPGTGPGSQTKAPANIHPSTASESSTPGTCLRTLDVLLGITTIINEGLEDGKYDTPLLPSLTGEGAELVDDLRKLTEQFVILHYQHDRPLEENEARRDYLREQYRKLMRKKGDLKISEQQRVAVGWNPHLNHVKLLTMFSRIVTQEMILANQRFEVMVSKPDEGNEDKELWARFAVDEEKYENQAVEARAKLEVEGEALVHELGEACRALLGPSDSQSSRKEKMVAVMVGSQVRAPSGAPILHTDAGDYEVTLVSWDGT